MNELMNQMNTLFNALLNALNTFVFLENKIK